MSEASTEPRARGRWDNAAAGKRGSSRTSRSESTDNSIVAREGMFDATAGGIDDPDGDTHRHHSSPRPRQSVPSPDVLKESGEPTTSVTISSLSRDVPVHPATTTAGYRQRRGWPLKACEVVAQRCEESGFQLLALPSKFGAFAFARNCTRSSAIAASPARASSVADSTGRPATASRRSVWSRTGAAQTRTSCPARSASVSGSDGTIDSDPP